MKVLKLTTTGVLLMLSFFLVGCNTAKGIGQDVSTAGQKIEDAAERNDDSDDD